MICPVYLFESTATECRSCWQRHRIGTPNVKWNGRATRPRQSDSGRQQAVSTTKRADIILHTHRVLPSILTRTGAHISRPHVDRLIIYTREAAVPSTLSGPCYTVSTDRTIDLYANAYYENSIGFMRVKYVV